MSSFGTGADREWAGSSGDPMNTTLFTSRIHDAERAVRESERRYERLLGSVTDYVYTVTVDRGRPVATSHGPGCEAVTGYTADELDADLFLWYRMVHEQDRARVLAHAEEILNGQRATPLEHRITRKDGTTRWIKNTPVPRRDNGSRLLAYDGLVSDITERKRAEQLLSVQFIVTRELAQAFTLQGALMGVFKNICEILEFSDWNWAAFWKVDKGSRVLRCSEAWHSRSSEMELFEAASRRFIPGLGVGLPGRVWARGESIWIPDLAEDPGFQGATYADQVQMHGACAVPIFADQETVGILELLSRKTLPEDPDQLRVLETVANQLGLFIERTQADEKLRLSEARLEAILDNSPAVIYVKDAQGRYLLTNRRYQDLFHVRREEVVGKTDSDLFPKETALVLKANDQRVIEARSALEFEEVVPHDGQPHDYISVKFPLLSATGEFSALCGISTDITARKRAETALRESQERLALVIEGSNDGIWDWDLTTNTSYFSPRWKCMLGYEDHELENNYATWESLLHPEDREPALARLQAYLAGEAPNYELEHRLRHKDGTYRWILARGVVLRDAAGKPIRMAGSHVDLTERKVAGDQLKRAYMELAQNQETLSTALHELKTSHSELQRTQMQLIQAAKLESVGTLAAGVAHEVKNPLQTIILGVDYLGRNLADQAEAVTMTLSDMRDAVERANNIIQELLHYSASAVFKVKEEDLNGLVERSLWLINSELVASQTRLVCQFGANLSPVKIDRCKMEQVLINIFINALQAMTQGGMLTVTTRAARFGEDPELNALTFPQFKAGERLVLLQVRDTGTGIAEGDLQQIFDPFFTTKPAGTGTGLGLSVAKTIVNLHGGAIHVRNVPEGGVLVTLVLRVELETNT